MTVVLTVRDVPEEVRDLLASQARERGQSLQGFLLRVLSRQADFGRNRQILAEVTQELEGGDGAGQDAPDPAELIARARAERSLPDAASSTRPDRNVA